MLILGLVSCNDDSDFRNRFIGRYKVVEESLETYVPRDDYEVRIRKALHSENQIIIVNFYNLDVEVFAVVDGNDITIPEQQHQVYEYAGSGSLSGNVIRVDYTVRSAEGDGNFFDRLRAEMTLID